MRKDKNSLKSAALLHDAEEEYKKLKSVGSWAYTNEGIQKLVHELQVHQIELEMQNEQLRDAEMKASMQADRYRALYDFFPGGYFTLDREGNLIELNLTGAKMLGDERVNLVNTSFIRFLTLSKRTVFSQFLERVFELEITQSCDVSVNVEGKPPIFVHLEGLMSEDRTQCFIKAQDITAFKEGIENLRESEILYRRLFESAKDGILILDAVNGEILDVNPFLVQLIGYSYDELKGKELWEIGTFRNIGYSQQAFTELQIKEYIRYDDMPLVTKSGKKINVEFISNVYVANHVKVIQCNIRDITERKLMEKALKDSEASLREMVATKDKFFSIIAHDLRSPFNTILGFSELLVEEVNKKHYEEVEKFAHIIQHSSNLAMELIINLLEWSRLQAGRMRFNPDHMNLTSQIKSVTQLLNNSAQHKDIAIFVDAPEKMTVFADEAMMGTILRNMVSNAIKFTHPGGEIVVSVKPEKDQLIVMVADNGVGIKKEGLKKIFTIEENYSTAGTQNEKGTGLGLVMCKDFIEKHGGVIWVESEPGKGSKFYFTIPQHQRKFSIQPTNTPDKKE